MKAFRTSLVALSLLALALFASVQDAQAKDKTLDIPPVAQNTAVWCWLAVGEMVFRYHDIPNINNFGVYQCGIAAAFFGGACVTDCRMCSVGSGPLNNMAAMLKTYPQVVTRLGLNAASITVEPTTSSLDEDEVKEEINEDRPIVAGISPHSGRLPPGLSEHAVLIVGYRESGSTLYLLVNDPFPYLQAGVQDPYTPHGGTLLQPGRYRISYKAMVDDLNWGNTISGIDTE